MFFFSSTVLRDLSTKKACMKDDIREKKKEEKVIDNQNVNTRSTYENGTHNVFKKGSTYTTDAPNKIIKRGSTYSNIRIKKKVISMLMM